MASPKALAAIALTLIIAVPICLGYGLASHDVPYDTWETSNSINLSDQILNYSTPYTIENMGPANNSELMQKWIFIGPGATETHRVAPEYRSIGDTYSSLPEYTTEDTDLTLPSATTATYSLNYSGTIVGVGTVGSGATYTVNEYDRYSIGINTSGIMPDHWAFYTNKGTDALSNDTITIIRDGGDSWTAIVNGNTITGITWWAVKTNYSGTVSVAARNYTGLSVGSNFSFSTTSGLVTGLKLTAVGGSPTYYTYTTSQQIVNYTGGDVLVGTEAYSNIAAIAVGFPAGQSSVTVSVPTPTGKYADPSQGWGVPTYDDRAYYTWWSNGHQNDRVDMMLKFDGNSTIHLSPTQGMTQEIGTYTIVYNDGNITVNSEALGSYQYVEAIFTKTGATFYGIPEWPSMTQSPFRLNSLSFDEDIGLFSSIQISGADLDAVSFRVDSANIIAGSFPSTKDYTIDMAGLFPGKSYGVKLNSIGVYGDTLTVGSTSFDITNGRITIDGQTVLLKGSIISSRHNGTNYDVYVSGYNIGTSSVPASITFGGEWSLTVTANLLVKDTGTKAEWSPGGFAFDKDELVGSIVLVAALVFIGVGLYGARNGVKVGLLLMICGGAALIALTTI